MQKIHSDQEVQDKSPAVLTELQLTRAYPSANHIYTEHSITFTHFRESFKSSE